MKADMGLIVLLVCGVRACKIERYYPAKETNGTESETTPFCKSLLQYRYMLTEASDWMENAFAAFAASCEACQVQSYGIKHEDVVCVLLN